MGRMGASPEQTQSLHPTRLPSRLTWVPPAKQAVGTGGILLPPQPRPRAVPETHAHSWVR